MSDPSTQCDPKALLDAANHASEKVATLHAAFLALCAYVLVIVFSTAGMDLLVGKGIKLPLVDVEVPITGFYAAVPYLLVLVHFNLLLQLQLLSRKLFAFDQAAFPGWKSHDQLNIFPFNYYLIGHSNQLIHWFIKILVTITILILPLFTMLMLQARFLAYQNPSITWAQRGAIWWDVGLVFVLWPVIMARDENSGTYFENLWRQASQHWAGWAWDFIGYAVVLGFFFVAVSSLLWLTLVWILIAWLSATLFFVLPHRSTRSTPPAAPRVC